MIHKNSKKTKWSTKTVKKQMTAIDGKQRSWMLNNTICLRVRMWTEKDQIN